MIDMYLAPYSGKVAAMVDLWNCQTLSLKDATFSKNETIFDCILQIETFEEHLKVEKLRKNATISKFEMNDNLHSLNDD